MGGEQNGDRAVEEEAVKVKGREDCPGRGWMAAVLAPVALRDEGRSSECTAARG